jgi:hypothetical protein
MDSDITLDGLDFEARGYFACPDAPTPEMTQSADHDAWIGWLNAFLAASRRGDFAGVAGLAPMQKAVTDVVWRGVVGDLLGDAGPDSVLEDILGGARQEPGAAGDFEYALHLCRELRGWGRLDVVPVLLSVWEQFATVKDVGIIPVFISDLIEAASGPLSDADPFRSVAAYREAVMARYLDRVAKFGADRVFILQGARFGVNRIAERIIQQIREPVFPTFLRRSFEASTGIDCTDFFRNGVLCEMPIKRKMEAFLDSPATEKFADGKRYFFGHPIP